MAQKNSSMSNSLNHGQEPKPDRWYNINLGSSFTDALSTSKFCSLRYEFKPASVDRSHPGELHKGKDNHVTVEYQNIQAGRPKVTFKGVSEDYKENDAVLLFDGECFRLERLHRGVKRLRHERLPGESALATSSCASAPGLAVENHHGPGGKNRPKMSGPPIPVQVEQIDVRGSENIGLEIKEKEKDKDVEKPVALLNPSASPDFKHSDSDEDIDIIDDDNQPTATYVGSHIEKDMHSGFEIDVSLPSQSDLYEDIGDVDMSDDDADRARSGAEPPKDLTNVVAESEKSSSSSGSSGSDSSRSENGSRSGSGSGSGSSSSDTETSNADSDISV